MRFLFILAFLMGSAAQADTRPVECQQLIEHLPNADVAYQPGVDAQGKAVVPADLNAVPFTVPEVITIPLSVDLARRLPDPPDGVLGEAPLGFLEVHQNGRVTYDGQDWTPQIYAICHGETLPPLPAEDGQPAAKPLESPPVIKNTGSETQHE